MFRLTYSPPDAEQKIFELASVDDLSASEAEVIEEAGGVQWRTFLQWGQLMVDGSFRAWRVLLWIMLRRTNPELDLNEVIPNPVSSLDFDFIEDEPTPEQQPPPDGEPAEPEGKDGTGVSDTSSP